MASAGFQRRLISERYRETRRLWGLLVVVMVGLGAAVGAVVDAASPGAGFPGWVAFALIGGVFAYGVRGRLAGTIHLENSVESESWTSSDLRRALGPRWRVVNGLDFGVQGDVDHIAVGPGGVFVVETKFTDSTRVRQRDAEDWVDQTRVNARRVRLLLEHNYGHQVEVIPYIVVSGRHGLKMPTAEVPLIRRQDLRDRFSSHQDHVLTADEVEAIRAGLLDYRGLRADHDREVALHAG